jgi:hypothetical protein
VKTNDHSMFAMASPMQQTMQSNASVTMVLGGKERMGAARMAASRPSMLPGGGAGFCVVDELKQLLAGA